RVNLRSRTLRLPWVMAIRTRSECAALSSLRPRASRPIAMVRLRPPPRLILRPPTPTLCRCLPLPVSVRRVIRPAHRVAVVPLQAPRTRNLLCLTTETCPTTTRRPATTPGAGAGPVGPGLVETEEAPSITPPQPPPAAEVWRGGPGMPKPGQPSPSLRPHAAAPP